jgi:CRISPR system Cascade subunit CasE
MNCIARLEVDAETARAERISDSYDWHKKLWECFPGVPDEKRKEVGFLTRIDLLEGAFRLWILSKRRPVRPHWCPGESFDLKEISGSFFDHRYYAFDVRANPTKCVDRQGPDGNILLRRNGKRTKGKRVPLVKPEELHAWLVRKAKVRCHDERTGADIPGGFRIVDEQPLEISPMVENHFRRKEHSAYHGGVQFRGILEVTDKERFIESYEHGIGSAKGFGFGLLLLAPIDLKENKANP